MEPIEILILPERTTISADESSELDIVLEVRSSIAEATEADDPSGKALNLAIILDRSGSMAGKKLEAAKTSCAAVLKALRVADKLTVVTFDDAAMVVINPQVNREDALSKISEVSSGGQTNLSGGWYLGLLELQTHSTPMHNNRAILISDGLANAGETKQSILAAAAAKSRDLGISTSTVGIGDDFQEDLLNAIATESGGRFWYINDSRIEDIIDEEFKGSLSTAIDRPRIELKLPPGVTIRQELNTVQKAGSKYRLRPIKGSDFFNMAIRLLIEAPGSTPIELRAILYDGDKPIAECDQVIQRTPGTTYLNGAINPLVPSIVQQFQANASNERILSEMMEGDLEQLKKMLVVEVDKLGDIQNVLMDADNLDLRLVAELQHIGMDRDFKDASLVIAEMLQLYSTEPEVRSYLQRWRKIAMHFYHRMENRECHVRNFDVDLFNTLVYGAIDLADTLSVRHPLNSEVLSKYKETLSAHLARYQ